MAMRWEAFLDHVQERGEYATPQEAERAARTVLALLGAHLVGEVRAELAARLPETFAVILLIRCRPPSRSLRSDFCGRLRHGSREPAKRLRPGTSAPC